MRVYSYQRRVIRYTRLIVGYVAACTYSYARICHSFAHFSAQEFIMIFTAYILSIIVTYDNNFARTNVL